MTRIPFTKMVATGNDFVLVDTRRRVGSLASQWPAFSRAVCDRHAGIGADGLLVLDRSAQADVRMRIFNPDGSEPSMCGNGIRCLARYAHANGAAGRLMSIETRAGIKQVTVQSDDQVSVNMGTPEFLRFIRLKELGPPIGRGHADLVDSGVPHVVCWVKSVEAVNVETLGRQLRFHHRFRPSGANVDFMEIVKVPPERRETASVHRYEIRLRTYERGVEAETQACGTGAVAASAAVCRTFLFLSDERDEPEVFEVGVRVPGGRLRVRLSIEWRAAEGSYGFGHAVLYGQAVEIFSGTFRWNGRGRA